MDEGMALSLEPLDGYIVNFFDNGAERSTSFKFGPSDAFQRIYNYRLSKKMGVRELRDRKKELLSLNKMVIKTLDKNLAKRVRSDKAKSDAESKRKETEALQIKKISKVAKKRAKMEASALSLLTNHQ